MSNNIKTKLPGVNNSNSVLIQRDNIRKINENTKLLKQELSIEYRESREVLAPSKIDTLKDLQYRSALFSRKIDIEKRRLTKLNETLKQKALLLQSSRESSGIVGEKQDSTTSSHRRMSGFENRLENCLVKKNEVESENKHFISKIELVRRERVVFDSIYKKLEKELHESSHVLDRTKKHLFMTTSIKETVDKELQELQIYSKTAEKKFEKEFNQLKGKIGSTQRNAAENIRNIEMIPEDKHVFGELSTEEEEQILRISAQAKWKSLLDEQVTDDLMEQVKKYDKIFKKIYSTTGLTDATKIAHKIQSTDEENFNQFKFIEEMNQEREKLENEIECLNKEIDRCKLQEGIATSFQEKTFARSQDKKLLLMERNVIEAEDRFAGFSHDITQLKTSVHTIYNILSHSSNQSENNLENQGVTDTNILEFLGSIEKFVTNILMNQNKSNMKNTQSPNSPFSPDDVDEGFIGIGPTVPPKSKLQTLKVKPPDLNEKLEHSIDSETRPLSYNELLKNIVASSNDNES